MDYYYKGVRYDIPRHSRPNNAFSKECWHSHDMHMVGAIEHDDLWRTGPDIYRCYTCDPSFLSKYLPRLHRLLSFDCTFNHTQSTTTVTNIGLENQTIR